MNKYIAEFIGTFFLVLTVGCTGIGAGSGVIAPLAIAAALMVMVFAGGHISGAHYNPAVTVGVFIRGKVNSADVVPYMVAQLAGAAIAAVLVTKFLRAGVAVTPISPHVGPALLAEFLFTFALVYVVLNAATAEGTSGNSFYGLAIGMTVMTGAFAVGDISGGAFNPAVAFGISLLGISSWNNIWIYLVANFAAAIVAAFVFNIINPPAQVTPIATNYKAKVDFENGDHWSYTVDIGVAKRLPNVPVVLSAILEKPLNGGNKKFQVNFTMTYYFER